MAAAAVAASLLHLPDEMDDDSLAAEQPPSAAVQLRPHQLALLHRCQVFEEQRIALSSLRGISASASVLPGSGAAGEGDYIRTRIGIIGDRVGSGKSYVLLALVLATRGRCLEQEATVRSFSMNRVVISMRDQSTPLPTSLLVVPHNLCAQWGGYIAAFGGGLNVVHVSRSSHLEPLIQRRHDLASVDLIVVTNTYYNALASVLQSWRCKLRRVMFDEADSLAITGCTYVDAAFHWFVTASYANLLLPRGYCHYDYTTRESVWDVTGVRSTGFIKTVMVDLHNTLPRDLAKALVVRNRDDFVSRSFSMPEPVVSSVFCKTPVAIRVLSGVVDRAIMEYLNAGDVSGALSHVSPQNRSTEDNIIALLVDKYTRQLKNAESRLELAQTLQFETDHEREAELQRLERRRLELDNKIACIRERVTCSDTCSICFDAFDNKSLVPCCSNAFCFRCINMWLARTPSCPLCKAGVMPRELLVVNAGAASADQVPSAVADPCAYDLSPLHDKLQNLEAILRQRCLGEGGSGERARVLLFSAFENTFGQVVPLLGRLGLRYAFLKGNHFQVGAVVNRYKAGDLDVLLVNTRNYGSGLNLETTTDLVMFHKFDSCIEKQVLGRAQRSGRTQPLRVWYLLHENEQPATTASSSRT